MTPGLGDVTLAETSSVAARLLAEAGLPVAVAIERLAGGKNNRVFRLSLADGSSRVLKRYHVDPRDDRDRLGAEWRFLSYVWERGVRSVPEPIVADAESSAGLYGFVEGVKLDPREVDLTAVLAAADFVAAINAEPRRPEQLGAGSEACFSLRDHIGTVDRRVERLSDIDPEAPLAEQARGFVAQALRPAWADVRSRILDAIAAEGLDPAAPIDTVVISPSDFGFHNMLRDRTGRLAFIDFEYAGRDDPAKLVCDFFCQPEISVPFAFFEAFADRVGEAVALPPRDRARCALLIDAYRIKWVCIVLNEFLAVGSSRRAFADDGARAERCARQLARAALRLETVQHPL